MLPNRTTIIHGEIHAFTRRINLFKECSYPLRSAYLLTADDLFGEALFPFRLQELVHKAAVTGFLFGMQDKNIASLRAAMVCDARQCRAGTVFPHHLFGLCPLRVRPSAPVTVVYYILAPFIIGGRLRRVNELGRVLPCGGSARPHAVIRVQKYEFLSGAGFERLPMPLFPGRPLVLCR